MRPHASAVQATGCPSSDSTMHVRCPRLRDVRVLWADANNDFDCCWARRSKLWNKEHGDVAGALQKVLEDLQLDYLDLYLVHWCAAGPPCTILHLTLRNVVNTYCGTEVFINPCPGFGPWATVAAAHEPAKVKSSMSCIARPVANNEGPKVEPSPLETWKQMEAQVHKNPMATSAHTIRLHP